MPFFVTLKGKFATLSIPLPLPQDIAPQLEKFCCLTNKIVFHNYAAKMVIPHIPLFEV